jgi:hypothetical protein
VHALDWLLASLTEDNDEVVILRVIEPGSSAHAVWKSGNRGMEEAREEAESVLEQVMRKNGDERQVRHGCGFFCRIWEGTEADGMCCGEQISIIVEFAIGPIEETIHRWVLFLFLAVVSP